jgi:hypothetical protein
MEGTTLSESTAQYRVLGKASKQARTDACGSEVPDER